MDVNNQQNSEQQSGYKVLIPCRKNPTSSSSTYTTAVAFKSYNTNSNSNTYDEEALVFLWPMCQEVTKIVHLEYNTKYATTHIFMGWDDVQQIKSDFCSLLIFDVPNTVSPMMPLDLHTCQHKI
uniref:GDSL esterase/lipase At2g04570 n=1 Tax=Zeugodacus cucurbitae TaxID=28588 RepID=A0A0A1XL97_ZEUCU